MPTVKIFIDGGRAPSVDLMGALPDLRGRVARIMRTRLEVVHCLVIEAVADPDTPAVHLQIEYLPTSERTEAFIAAASEEVGREVATITGSAVRVRSWPTVGVAMADVALAEA